MSWVSFLNMLLAIANTVANIVREKQLMSAGEALTIERSMKELAKRLELGSNIQDAIETMPEYEIDRRLRGLN